MKETVATAADSSIEHPVWLTAQDWLDSSYHRQWNPEGKFRVLFDLGKNQSMCEVFPIYPVAELMIRVQEGWCYQPYGCRCESTGEVETQWVYVRVTDFSHELELKSIREHIERELTYYRYSTHTWWGTRGFDTFRNLEAEFTRQLENGQECRRSTLTHQELQQVLEVPILREVWEEAQDRAMKNLSWYKESPSRETPVKVYAAGSDDSSYTKVYETVEHAMVDIERFKVDGMPEQPDQEGWIFTN